MRVVFDTNVFVSAFVDEDGGHVAASVAQRPPSFRRSSS